MIANQTTGRGRVSVDFAGRTALVTGAAGGIGSAIARRLAAGGANVCLHDLADLGALAAELEGSGVGVAAIHGDAAEPLAAREAIERTCAKFGAMDILVTSAGVTSSGSFETIAESEWDRVHSINLKGVFSFNQAAIAPMRERNYGRIVNIGSVLAKNGGNPRPWLDPSEQERAGNAAYGSAKAGVHALTKYLSKELAGFGITVNAVAPGPIASSMTAGFPEALIRQIPAGRMGIADEVAAAVVFLAAQESGFITGEILDVNGGLWID